MNDELLKVGYLTQEDYTFFKTNLAGVDFIASYTMADNLYEKLYATASATASSQAKDLLLGVDYGSQLFKKFQFVLKFKKWHLEAIQIGS